MTAARPGPEGMSVRPRSPPGPIWERACKEIPAPEVSTAAWTGMLPALWVKQPIALLIAPGERVADGCAPGVSRTSQRFD
jgi:hypothetical protein